MIAYVALALALLALALLLWHVVTPTPPAHTRRLVVAAGDLEDA